LISNDPLQRAPPKSKTEKVEKRVNYATNENQTILQKPFVVMNLNFSVVNLVEATL
jgi:hypothetical protein